MLALLKNNSIDDDKEDALEVVGGFDGPVFELLVVEEFDSDMSGFSIVLPIVNLRTGFLATWLCCTAFDNISVGMGESLLL